MNQSRTAPPPPRSRGCARPGLTDALGIWDGAFLGSWTNYTTLVPWTGLLLECVHPRYLVLPAAVVTAVCAVIASVSAANLYDVATRSNRYAGDTAYVCVWLGFGTVTSICGFLILTAFARPDLSPKKRYDTVLFAGRLIPGASGTVLAAGILAASVSDPTSVMQHPHSFGSIATSVSWLGFGLLFTPRNRRRLLGGRSVQHWFFDLDQDGGVSFAKG